MLELTLCCLTLSVLTLGLAIFANRLRRTHELPFELTPNCLLTRWPVVFVTGRRSLFYFSRYWNLYPVFLAEHGYEVFTVYVPWKDSALRRRRFEMFLSQQKQRQQRFHLVVDGPTREEFKDLFPASEELMSLTVLQDRTSQHPTRPGPVPEENLEFSESDSGPRFLRLSFFLHRLACSGEGVPTANTLGALPASAVANSLRLLTRMQTLAEMDLREDA